MAEIVVLHQSQFNIINMLELYYLAKRKYRYSTEYKTIMQTPDISFFLRILYHIPYHGQKSDIISSPISRQKIGKGYISYILSNFILHKKHEIRTINFYFENIQYTTFLKKSELWTEHESATNVQIFFANIYWQFLPTTSVNKNYIAQKKKLQQSSNSCCKKGYRIWKDIKCWNS
jgi:hypothetical protein